MWVVHSGYNNDGFYYWFCYNKQNRVMRGEYWSYDDASEACRKLNGE